jgi:hypothetical protein
MAGTGMLALDLCACLASLLYDQVRGVSLHHRFDIGPLVAWNHYKAIDLRRDPVVLAGNEFDLLDTGFLTAFTVKRQRPVDAMLSGALVDPLIDAAKDLLVMSRPLREVHRTFLRIPRRQGNTPPSEP